MGAAPDIAVRERTGKGADPGPGWQAAAIGRVETEAGAVLLLDIGALVAGPNPASAESLAA